MIVVAKRVNDEVDELKRLELFFCAWNLVHAVDVIEQHNSFSTTRASLIGNMVWQLDLMPQSDIYFVKQTNCRKDSRARD
jgi:hypothetical protein